MVFIWRRTDQHGGQNEGNFKAPTFSRLNGLLRIILLISVFPPTGKWPHYTEGTLSGKFVKNGGENLSWHIDIKKSAFPRLSLNYFFVCCSHANKYLLKEHSRLRAISMSSTYTLLICRRHILIPETAMLSPFLWRTTRQDDSRDV